MTRQKLIAVAVALSVASFLLGRFTAPDSLVDEIPRRGEKVASFSGGSIGVDDVREVVPAAGTTEHAKAAIETLVRARVLAGRAEDAGLHLTPAFLARYTEELAGLYVTDRFEKPFEKQLPTDDDVRKFFDENKARLGRPERVRVAHIALRAPKTDATARALKRAEALKLLGEARRSAREEYGFGRLAITSSQDSESRAAGGELPYLTREELGARLGMETIYPAFAATPGQVLEGIVETEQGFQVLKVIAREEGREPSYDELRDTIRARLTQERHDKAFKEFLAGVWTDANVKYDEKVLERLVAESKQKGPKQGAKQGSGSR